MIKTLIASIETVIREGLTQMTSKSVTTEEDILYIKILSPEKVSVPVSALRDIVSCGQHHDVEVVPYSGENEKFLLLGTFFSSADESFVFDEALGTLPAFLFQNYDIKTLPALKRQKNKMQAPEDAKVGGTKASKKAVQETKTDSAPLEKKYQNPYAGGDTFESFLSSKGVKAGNKHEQKLKVIFASSEDKDAIRRSVMDEFGLDIGGKILAKLDGSFEKLHELANS